MPECTVCHKGQAQFRVKNPDGTETKEALCGNCRARAIKMVANPGKNRNVSKGLSTKQLMARLRFPFRVHLGNRNPGDEVKIVANPEIPGSKSRFHRHRQIPPGCFRPETFKTVPIEHTTYPKSGKYSKPGVMTITGKLRKKCLEKYGEPGKKVPYRAWAVQSILTPRKMKLQPTLRERALERNPEGKAVGLYFAKIKQWPEMVTDETLERLRETRKAIMGAAGYNPASEKYIKVTEEDQNLNSTDKKFDANIRLENGLIYIDVFDSKVVDADSAHVNSDAFENTPDGRNMAKDFLREYNINVRFANPKKNPGDDYMRTEMRAQLLKAHEMINKAKSEGKDVHDAEDMLARAIAWSYRMDYVRAKNLAIVAQNRIADPRMHEEWGGSTSENPKKKYLIAIKGGEIFEFDNKHDRAMFLDAISHHGRKKIDYAFSEINPDISENPKILHTDSTTQAGRDRVNNWLDKHKGHDLKSLRPGIWHCKTCDSELEVVNEIIPATPGERTENPKEPTHYAFSEVAYEGQCDICGKEGMVAPLPSGDAALCSKCFSKETTHNPPLASPTFVCSNCRRRMNIREKAPDNPDMCRICSSYYVADSSPNPESGFTTIETIAEQKPNIAKIKGVIIDVKPGSGLIMRCPECKRRLINRACRIHGTVTGVPDLRIRAVIDDGTGALIVVMDRSITESLTGHDVNYYITLENNKGYEASRQDIFEQIVAKPFEVEGRITVDDYGIMLIATSASKFEKISPNPVDRTTEKARRFTQAHNIKTIKDAYEYYLDDRSHGNEFIADAAKESWESWKGRADAMDLANIGMFMESVERRAKEMEDEDDKAPECPECEEELALIPTHGGRVMEYECPRCHERFPDIDANPGYRHVPLETDSGSQYFRLVMGGMSDAEAFKQVWGATREEARAQFENEKKEHPDFTEDQIWQIVKDHFQKKELDKNPSNEKYRITYFDPETDEGEEKTWTFDSIEAAQKWQENLSLSWKTSKSKIPIVKGQLINTPSENPRASAAYVGKPGHYRRVDVPKDKGKYKITYFDCNNDEGPEVTWYFKTMDDAKEWRKELAFMWETPWQEIKIEKAGPNATMNPQKAPRKEIQFKTPIDKVSNLLEGLRQHGIMAGTDACYEDPDHYQIVIARGTAGVMENAKVLAKLYNAKVVYEENPNIFGILSDDIESNPGIRAARELAGKERAKGRRVRVIPTGKDDFGVFVDGERKMSVRAKGIRKKYRKAKKEAAKAPKEEHETPPPAGKKLKLSDIPEDVKLFMPEMQQKAIVGSEEHWEILERLKKTINSMPKSYETEKVPVEDKIAYLHYFHGGSDWYIFEKDKEKEQQQAFGYAILNGDLQNAEVGYINIEELKQTNTVELDFFFKPQKFNLVLPEQFPAKKEEPAEMPAPKKRGRPRKARLKSPEEEEERIYQAEQKAPSTPSEAPAPLPPTPTPPPEPAAAAAPAPKEPSADELAKAMAEALQSLKAKATSNPSTYPREDIVEGR